MQIGNIRLSAPVALAPMAGITDMPFRIICKELGCGLVVSEMVSAKGLLYKNVKTFDMLRIAQEERPAAIQLFGSNPMELARAAKIVEADGADIIDFNMGCPVPKIVNNGEGSALMKNPQLAYEILARMADSVKIPVTVKIRAGWDEKNINAPEIALLAEKAGVAAIAVHGRTREQYYNGKADWNIIKKVKETVWQFIQPYLKSQKEFEIRFGIVMLFHYINEEHIDSLLAYADLFKHEAYYARMAMAWMISICFIKFPQKTMKYLQQSKLDDWTYNKAIQKTIESLRINKETKDTLRTMKRR